MDHIVLGRTGLSASVMGLGCGGHSRLGLAQQKGEANAVAVVRRALDLGVNFIDTAEAYGTEEAVGKALDGVPRDSVILSTKISAGRQGQRTTPADLKARADACLARLRTDYVDVLHLHGVSAEQYDYCAETLVPALRELQAAGKVRFLGITEAFGPDPQHRALVRAIEDDCWDVMMIGFNLLNPSARERLFAVTRAKGIGVLCMFAVRRALQGGEPLRDLVRGLVAEGKVPAESLDADDPLGFLVRDDPEAAKSLTEAAYRFCRHEPGIHVVLSGTGSPAHLEENAAALLRPPLPDADRARLAALFGGVDSVSGN
ncbi:MAG TPA: aldo/keto reductase [Armatimonadaceae bacterium]|nr:aldo/keto reductase [Armatimonadaceae bacterium]